MKRRIRSSSGLSRTAAARAALLALVAGLGSSAVACSSDLFHDTKWQSRCDLDASEAICPQDAGGGGGASATSSAGTTTSGGSTSGSASSTAGAGGAGGEAATSTGTTMQMTASSSTG
jgi:hypothetical protein